MIQLVNVSKGYKNIELFEDINVEFEMGKKILIKGFNGSGKSVLLKMIIGYSKPDEGEILIDGIALGKGRDYLNDAGVSINHPEFMNHLTGLENLLILADIRKVATKEDIEEYAKMLNLKHLDKKYKTYSLGMKQKLRLIQAIMDKPKYLILDEPFDGLDKSSQAKSRELLDSYMKEDNILIFTSHNPEYEDFADIVYEIDDYKLVKIK